MPTLREPQTPARGSGLASLRSVAVAVVAVVLALGACGSPSVERGTAPEGAELSFAFGLARDQQALAGKVWDVSTPGAADYTGYLSAPDIADKFGASQDTVKAAMRTLSKAGFQGGADPTRGVITGTFSAREAEAFFGVPMDQTTRADGTAYVSARSEVGVPSSLQSQVVDVFGGWATTQPDPTTGKQPPNTQPSASAQASAADPPCPSNERGLQARAVIDQMYGLDPYYRSGLTGKGVRVGMLSIEQYSPRALELYERCFNRTLPPVETTQVNAPVERLDAGNIETSMDLIFMGIFAPGIDAVDVYQFDKMTSTIFPLADVLAAQGDPAKAVDVLTTSVGFCAANLSAGERSMSDWLAMSLAATGVTYLASSGDGGSSSCYPPGKQQSTQYPSESAFATSVGGTQVEGADGATPGQAVWNEAPRANQAGGGGPAGDTPRPPYQSALTGADVRQTPDVAFVAAPGDVGPIAYCNRGAPCRFQVVAGTSATAPGFAAVVAMLLEYVRQNSPEQRIGLLNPAIYQFAQGPAYAQAFMDITQGTNDLFGVGCCTAAPGYDMASGWGSLRLDQFGTLMVDALKART